MRVLILGYDGHLLASPSRFRSAATRLGIDLRIESPDGLAVHIVESQVSVTLHGEQLDCDAILPRGTTPVGPFLDAALSAAAAAGIAVINSPVAIRTCEDKLRTAVALAHAGVPQLPTAGLLPGGTCPPWEGPVYVKPAWASRGRGVTLHATTSEVDEVLQDMRRTPLAGPLAQHLVVQPAATTTGVDYRVLVARGTAIAVIERRATGGSVVSNGADSTKRALRLTDTPDLCAVGVAAADAVGAQFAGVDVIVHDGLPCVLEVNASPGLDVTGRLAGINLEELLLSLAV